MKNIILYILDRVLLFLISKLREAVLLWKIKNISSTLGEDGQIGEEDEDEDEIVGSTLGEDGQIGEEDEDEDPIVGSTLGEDGQIGEKDEEEDL